jgi:hypothetical protein
VNCFFEQSLDLNIGAGFRSLGTISLASMCPTKPTQENFDEYLVEPRLTSQIASGRYL